MEIRELIHHPELMDRDTLYELRSTLALHPYFQNVRLLMLQNLYLLHDPLFDEELRRAAIYLTDRKAIFNMIEAAHYQIREEQRDAGRQHAPNQSGSRTVALIDTFLDSIPKDAAEEGQKKRRPTPADAAVDYVAYLLESEASGGESTPAVQMKGQDLIDTFLEQEKGRILLKELPEGTSPADEQDAQTNDDSENNEEYFTETLARIYIRQGRYQKAYDIIQRLSTSLPQKNTYFADQLRFLEKLIINSNNKKN